MADPSSSESALTLATDVHCALVGMMVDEAFSAALETEATINSDAKQRDMHGGYPVVTVCIKKKDQRTIISGDMHRPTHGWSLHVVMSCCLT